MDMPTRTYCVLVIWGSFYRAKEGSYQSLQRNVRIVDKIVIELHHSRLKKKQDRTATYESLA